MADPTRSVTEPPPGSMLRRMASSVQTLISRAKLASRAGVTFEAGVRDLDKAMGYNRVLNFVDYSDRFARGGIDGRIVSAMPVATWRDNPSILEGENIEPNTDFEIAWAELAQRLKIYHKMQRMDILSGIGRYGVLLIGMADGRELKAQAGTLRGPEDIIFLSLFTEGNAAVKSFETSINNERFGLPADYRLSLNSDSLRDVKLSKNVEVHWSRIIHVAENLQEDDMFGIPRLQQVWNLLDDLDKVTGASGEAFWRNSERGIQFDVDKDMELSPEDETKFDEEIENYMHDFQRYIRTKGIKAIPLGVDVADPRGTFAVLAANISGTINIPMRILFGSERGQLASTQDERNFNARIATGYGGDGVYH